MTHRIRFTVQGWEDYQSWTSRTLLRINRMIEESVRSPGEGIGKPERLRANLAGLWSRRIDQEHRLVYAVRDEGITVLQCRYHY